MKKLLLLCFLSITVFLAPRPLSAQVVVNEYSCANLSLTIDNYDKHEDWIELYNTSTTAVNIGGWHLSDDADEPTKWTFPASVVMPGNSYLIVWCSGRDEVSGGHYHSNFKFTQTKKKSEDVVLADAAGNIIESRKVKKTQMHQSIGRVPDGGEFWGIFGNPTPKTTNDNAHLYADFAKKPDVSVEAGFFQNSVTVELTTTEPNASIHYTTDGSDPSINTPAYSGPLSFQQTTVLKAATFSENQDILPSFQEINTYFINVNHTLPVVSVSGYELDVLANGSQGLRPKGSFELFGTDKLRKSMVTGELNSHGQDSWVNDQRSIDWVSRDEMGINSAVKEVLFPGLTDRDEFQRVILRAAGDDNYPGGSGWPYDWQTGEQFPPLAAHVRDAYTQNLAKRGQMNVDTRTGSKAIIYINGVYWGVYDLRELPDDHDYTDYNYDQGKYDLQYLLTWGGTWEAYWTGNPGSAYEDWKTLYDFTISNDMSDPANFQVVADQYDYTSLVDYMIVNSFANASDWLNYNTGWWRGQNPDGGHKKWGYILWDLDATYAYYINYTGIADTGAYSAPCNVELLANNSWSDPEGHVTMLNNLRGNADFDQYWISRQADMMKTVFSCENMLSYLDSVVASIEPEMPMHVQRWNGSMDEWHANVARLRNFIERRCEYLPEGLASCYNLTGPFNLKMDVEPAGAGAIKANTLVYDQFPTETPIFGNINLKLEAIPDSGYVFDHWQTIHSVLPDPLQSATQSFFSTGDTIVAVFRVGSVPTVEPGKSDFPNLKVTPTLVQNDLRVQYTLPSEAPVSIRLYDLAGALVNTMLNGSDKQNAGDHYLHFNFGNQKMPPGMYFLHFDSGQYHQVVKLVIIP